MLDKLDDIIAFEEDNSPDDGLLEKSINRAINESNAGLGVDHEQIWKQLKLS